MGKINQVFCLFEQSGTFKNCFREMGIPAFDYDIENEFGETDYQLDLFKEIEEGYFGRPSIFDKMGKDDLLMIFFPCTYFEGMQTMIYQCCSNAHKNISMEDKIKIALARTEVRELFYCELLRLTGIIIKRGLRAIIENPWVMSYLEFNYIKPTFIDWDRTRRGDYYKKRTAYWFFNIECGNGFTMNRTKKENLKFIKNKNGEKERSMISKEYAKNFICDQILKTSPQRDYKQLLLFE